MLLLLIAYAGGVLTILSPCILPVLPFVLARADRRFVTHGLPLLLGMAVAFVVVGTLAAVVGQWAVTANRIGRDLALVAMALFGLALLWPSLSDRLSRPLVALGNRLSQSSDDERSGVISSAALGVATGLLWAPCAGPILGLIFSTAALEGASLKTSLLLAAYALGACTALAVALLAGRRVFAAMKSSLHAAEGVRRGLGALVLLAAVAIFFGFDTGALARLSTASTTRLEQSLLERAGAAKTAPGTTSGEAANSGTAVAGGDMGKAGITPGEVLPDIKPTLEGGGPWLNSPPLTLPSLKGKVVLVDFWTYSCINCIRALPYVRAWAAKYKDAGLVVIGVHTPEFAFEKVVDNVRKAVHDQQVDYPVVLDNDYAIWRSFNNNYWPAHYFFDATGKLRHTHFGEGGYDESEQVIQQLLAENGTKTSAGSLVEVKASGAAAAADAANVQSPETYIGFDRAENFASPGGAVEDTEHDYRNGNPHLNQWGLDGHWTIMQDSAFSGAAGARITYVFHARDLHLVLGPWHAGQHVRFRVTIDGKPPGANHGMDVDAQGNGVIDSQRLYQLIRQQGAVGEHRFQIEFLDAAAQAFAFTFG